MVDIKSQLLVYATSADQSGDHQELKELNECNVESSSHTIINNRLTDTAQDEDSVL